MLVFHVGLFVFAFFSKSPFRPKFSKVTGIRTQTCVQISYIVGTFKVIVVVSSNRVLLVYLFTVINNRGETSRNAVGAKKKGFILIVPFLS